MADESDLGAVYLSRHGSQLTAPVVDPLAESGSVERQAGQGAMAPLDAAAQTGVSVAPMTPGGAPNLPPMIPPGTRVPIVPPGFRGDEPAAPGRPRMAPTPQMRPNAGIGAKGLLETAAEQIPDIGGAVGPLRREEIIALARGVDYIGSVLNVPYEAGATALVGAAQPYFDTLAQAGMPQAEIAKLQETLSQGYQIIGALVAPGAAGGMNLANPEAALAVVQGVGSFVKAIGSKAAESIATTLVAAHPKDFKPVVDALRTTQEGGVTTGVVTAMARAMGGMVAGSFVGDTQEEQARNALIGLGLGAVASPALIKRMVRGARTLASAMPEAPPRTMTTAVDSPHVTILPATDVEQARFLANTGDIILDTEWPGSPGVRQGVPKPGLMQVNWATIRDPASIDALTDAVTKARPVVKTVISQEETRVMASELGLTTQQVLETMEKQGGFSARMQAKKDLYVASRTKLGALAEQIDAMVPEAPGYLELDAAFRQQFGTSAALLQNFLDDASDTGRALNILKGGAQDMGDTAGMAAMAGQDVSAIPTETLVSQVKSLTAKGPEATTTYLQKLTNAGGVTLQTMNWAYIHGLLSTFEGSIANMLSNVMLMVESPLNRLGSAAIGSARESAARMFGMEGELVSRTYWGTPFAQVLGMVSAVPEGFGAVADILHAGAESKFGGLAKEMTRFRPTGDPTTWTGAAINGVAALIEFPNRVLLMAPDEFAKVLNYRGETWGQAYNMVEKEFAGQPWAPLRDLEARERFASIIRAPERTMQQVATGKTESVGDLATRAANERTLNEPLTGRLGKATEALSHPIVRMTVAPFQKIPINVLRNNWERIPVLGLAVERARDAWNAGGEAKDLLLVKWAVAGSLMTWGATHALTGEITAGGPIDPNLNALWQAEGFQRYSFVSPEGTVVSYNRFDVLGSLLGMTAEYAQLRAYMRQDEADAIASAMVLAVADNMLSKTFMRSAAELMNLVMSKRPQDLEKNKFLKSFIASYVPSGVAQVERKIDPTIRATYGLFDEIKARVPGYSAELPPKLEWLKGEPKLAPPGWSPDWLPGFVSVFSPVKVTHLKNDPVIMEMLRLQVSIPSPPPYLWGPDPDTLKPPNPKDGVPLTPEQHYYYIRAAAQTAVPNKVPGERDKTSRTQYEQLDALRQTEFYKKLTPTSQTDQIHAVVSAYRQHAQMLTLKKYPELAHAYAQRFVETGVDTMGDRVRPKLQGGADKLIESLTR